MLTTNAYVIYKSLELNSVTNAIFNFQSQVGAIPVFSCKFYTVKRSNIDEKNSSSNRHRKTRELNEYDPGLKPRPPINKTIGMLEKKMQPVDFARPDFNISSRERVHLHERNRTDAGRPHYFDGTQRWK